MGGRKVGREIWQAWLRANLCDRCLARIEFGHGEEEVCDRCLAKVERQTGGELNLPIK
jgi:hypothetical protein